MSHEDIIEDEKVEDIPTRKVKEKDERDNTKHRIRTSCNEVLKWTMK